MPIQDDTYCRRMVKRVNNAIHNPASNAASVWEAIKELKQCGIVVYLSDYDDWICEAIHVGSEKKLLALFKHRPRLITCTVLETLITYSPHNIPRYMASRMFNPNQKCAVTGSYTIDGIIGHTMERHASQSERDAAALFFKQPRAVPVLLRFIENKWFTKEQRIRYVNSNPVLIKRRQQRKILMRFWLLTTKSVLVNWRENLYIPGTGALYKKALNSFNST